MPSNIIKFEWNGKEVTAGMKRAVSRSLAGTAEDVCSVAKQTVHRVTGTLSRSIHTAEPEYEGQTDVTGAQGKYVPRNRADRRSGASNVQKVVNADGNVNYVEFVGGDDLQSGREAENDVREVDDGHFEVWVGSWIVYAFIEEVVRGHAYMAPALAAAGPRFWDRLAQAVQEELSE